MKRLPRVRRPALLGAALALSLVTGVSAVPVTPAGAAPVWAITPSPNVAGATATILYGVSCPDSATCFAVGYHSTAAGLRALIERWNGSGWTIVASPNPKGAIQNYLRAVSCPSPSNCFAVGNFSTLAVASAGVVEHWDGRHWAVVPSPNPVGAASSVLYGVSCPTAVSCFAVGGSSDATGTSTVTEHWDGTRWSIMGSPNPSGSTTNVLSSVSCPSPRSCFAVGSRGTVSGNGLVEHWNGTSWGIMGSPNRSSAATTSLYGVSCPTPKSCFAVGYYSLPHGISKSQVEHWNGTAWGIMASPNFTSAYNTTLFAIACPTAKSCFAVGHYFIASPVIAGSVVEHWNGSGWGIMGSPDTGIGNPTLSGVSCAARVDCFAVGSYLGLAAVTTSLMERYG